MKILFNINELTKVAKVASTVNDEGKETLVLRLGVAKDASGKYLCMARNTNSTAQIIYKFTGTSTDLDQPTQIVVSMNEFKGIVESLAQFKKDIYINVGDVVTIGVEGKAEIPLDCYGESIAQFEVGSTLFKFSVKAEEFAKFARKGLSCATMKAENNQPTQNCVLELNTTNGQMFGVSTDGVRFSLSALKVEMLRDEKSSAEDENLAKFCEKNLLGSTKEKFFIALPKQKLNQILNLIGDCDKFMVAFDGNKMYCQLGSTIMFIVTTGTSVSITSDTIGKAINLPASIIIGADNQTVLNGFGFINNMTDLKHVSGESNSVIHVTASSDGIKLETGVGGVIKSKIDVLGIQGDEEAETYLYGKFMASALNILDKGGVLLRLGQKAVILQNGNLQDGCDQSAVVGIMCANIAAYEKANKELEESEAEEDQE